MFRPQPPAGRHAQREPHCETDAIKRVGFRLALVRQRHVKVTRVRVEIGVRRVGGARGDDVVRWRRGAVDGRVASDGDGCVSVRGRGREDGEGKGGKGGEGGEGGGGGKINKNE